MSWPNVGAAAPDFSLTTIRSGDVAPRPVQLRDYSGRWLMLIFYPRDFTFVCPTELTAFGARLDDFGQRECELLGVSVDSVELHREWLTTPIAAGGLGPLPFPLASDPDGTVTRAYGVWVEEKQVSARGLFAIDPGGILQYAVVHNLNVGRSPEEVLRVLDALRTGRLCPASWTAADGTIDPERALQPGKFLGHYRIRKPLGSGTFGTVFAAWDLRLERMVALKVLKRNIVDSRRAVLAEARTAAKLNDPHVCTVHAVDEEDGLPVIVMEYLQGQPLSQAIEAGLPRATALQLAAQIASGLAAAHARDVVHGDLKPTNIIVTEDGTAKILDFGLARSQQAAMAAGGGAGPAPVAGAATGATHVAAGVEATVEFADPASDRDVGVRGSLAYMSPEQASGLAATAASDVFSFGLTLVEMLTGQRAHREPSPVKLLVRLQTEDLGAELADKVDGPCRKLLRPMLARAADDRPPMVEVARRIAAMVRA